MGASGSGKSMTLKCIAGIETPDQGKIILNDKVLFDYSITDFNYLKLYYGADNEHLTLC